MALILVLATGASASGWDGAIEEARRRIRADIEDWKDDTTLMKPVRRRACYFRRADLPAPWAHPGLPLQVTVFELPLAVSLTPAERRYIEDLRERADEIETEADRFRWVIDALSFRISVADRLYDQRMQFHSDYSQRCAELTWRLQRNDRLKQAAETLLGLYTQLERELGK